MLLSSFIFSCILYSWMLCSFVLLCTCCIVVLLYSFILVLYSNVLCVEGVVGCDVVVYYMYIVCGHVLTLPDP